MLLFRAQFSLLEKKFEKKDFMFYNFCRNATFFYFQKYNKPNIIYKGPLLSNEMFNLISKKGSELEPLLMFGNDLQC